MHTHASTFTPGAVTTNITLNGVSGGAASNSPAGALLQGDLNMNTFAPGSNTTVAMAASSTALTNIAGPTTLPTVTVQPAGAAGTPAHNNLQPYLGMNFIVCTAGVYPARN
jgi:microcystin-dependent protein